MTREEFTNELSARNFKFQRNSEYNRDEYTGVVSMFGAKCSLRVFVDYFTVRITWLRNQGSRFGKCYYISKELKAAGNIDEILTNFFKAANW